MNTYFITNKFIIHSLHRNANKSSVVLKPLPANTLYKMHLRTCTSAEPITEIIEVLTRPDVPGKVTNPRIRIDDGVVLSWDAPAKQPGVTVQFYSVEWEVHAGGDKGTANLTAEEFSLKVSTKGFLCSLDSLSLANSNNLCPIFLSLASRHFARGQVQRLNPGDRQHGHRQSPLLQPGQSPDAAPLQVCRHNPRGGDGLRYLCAVDLHLRHDHLLPPSASQGASPAAADGQTNARTATVQGQPADDERIGLFGTEHRRRRRR